MAAAGGLREAGKMCEEPLAAAGGAGKYSDLDFEERAGFVTCNRKEVLVADVGDGCSAHCYFWLQRGQCVGDVQWTLLTYRAISEIVMRMVDDSMDETRSLLVEKPGVIAYESVRFDVADEDDNKIRCILTIQLPDACCDAQWMRMLEKTFSWARRFSSSVWAGAGAKSGKCAVSAGRRRQKQMLSRVRTQ
jgi:hypothetical protein